MLREELEEKDIYIKECYILNKLIEEHDIVNIDNIVYDDLVSMEYLSMIEKISQLDDIVNEIVDEEFIKKTKVRHFNIVKKYLQLESIT